MSTAIWLLVYGRNERMKERKGQHRKIYIQSNSDNFNLNRW